MGVPVKTFSVSGVKEKPPQDQVFINFRGAELRGNFVSHLFRALESAKINVYMDTKERRGHQIKVLLRRIEESRIALAIFSPRYTESEWCVKELDRIMDCTVKGSLVPIPIFYKVEPSKVKLLEGDFGYKFKRWARGNVMEMKWAAAFRFVSNRMGITVEEKSDEYEKIVEIVQEVKKALVKFSKEGIPKDAMEPLRNLDAAVEPLGNLNAAVEPSGNIKDAVNLQTFGNKQRLKGLFDLLDKYEETRIIGVVGMPGIGKTTLLKEFFDIRKGRFSRHAFIKNIRFKFKDFDSGCLLPKILSMNDSNLDDVEDCYKLNDSNLDDVEDRYGALQKRKVLVILDDVSKREQIEGLREILKRTAKGSRCIIATNDMSLTYGQVDDIYMVPNLNYTDSLALFHYHAFLNDQANPSKRDFMKLSEGFVHYAKGHPRALTILGRELNKKNINLWNSKLEELAQNPSHSIIGSVFQESYDDLTSEQQDAFLDIAYFRSHYKDYIESLLASSETGSAEARSILKALSDKFLISTCDGRVDMHDLLYNFSRELDLKASTQNGSRQRRLWRHHDIIEEHKRSINVLRNKVGASDVRGIFLDLAEVKRETHLDCEHLINMCNLRYLKVYNSHCPQDCKTESKINMSDDLDLPLKEVRCLHWLKFPLKELPEDFNPINLVDLKLAYSMIKKLWDRAKDTPVLKLVDLNHSSELISLSGLSKARNLQRLNLEGCTSLESLGDVNLISLKTLILSNCSSFKEFPVNPTNLEALYLDGTAISQIPDNMVNLQRLVLLNMKDCKMLENIPSCVGELKALQKLVLSGCLKLKAFPEINESSLKILLLDGTSIQTMPLLPSVQYLCLSRNPQISYLPAGINKLSQLNRLELMYCPSLKSVPELPPNLQYLAAHGCMNLGQAAKEEITSYAQKKCQLPSYARKHYNEGLSSEALFSACFPGFEVPPWFCYEAVGSLLERKLPPHWHEKKLCGIVLCAVVQILDGQDQISCFSVTCTFKIKDGDKKIKDEDKSWIAFTCPVGSWTRNGDKKEKMIRNGDKEENTDPDHVFITYITCPQTIRILEDKNSNECNFTEFSLEFTVIGDTSVIRNFKVSRCGFSLVYER